MSALTSAILALLLHPHVQARAQREIDEVVGRDRLPDFSDRPRLPFVDAICREVLRWNVILPMAIAHASVRDDVYDGYFIPKGGVSLVSRSFSPMVFNTHFNRAFQARLWWETFGAYDIGPLELS